eukprot:m.26418 g.26418  ORF g.26418 m.26418 type:complete len:112 (+) comp29315_c0_seq1:340-675(+)
MKLWFQDEKYVGSPGCDLDVKINKEEVMEVAKRIQGFWRRIAEQLGPDPKFESHDLHEFSRKDNDRDRAQAILEEWCERKDTKATRRELVEVLKKEKKTTQIHELFGHKAG